MRDPGLARAIDKAGGVAELARKIGIAQPSLSNWNRVPAQRVIAVEAATGISRRELRPDLYDDERTLDELMQSALEGDPPVFSSREERDSFEQRYAEANPRWNRIPEAQRRFIDELIERRRGRT